MATRPHAFVAMPFGTKPGRDGKNIDFNRVYAEYIKPALETAGLEPFRADEETRAGDIRVDMFQELLVADLVIADLTIDNPNVWYEVGVRHALRARGVILVFGQATTAFDLYTDRKLRYQITDGAPDPATVEADKNRLVDMIRATMESWHGRKVSPVYSLMPNLQEPDWKSLRIGDVREFWELHDAWASRIDLARKDGRIGDLLVLADESPVAAFRADAWLKAGESLRKAGRFKFALEQLERGLEVAPTALRALREKGICLQRFAVERVPGFTLERARDHYDKVLLQYPDDPETWALLGRVDKDAWTSAWREKHKPRERMREDAAYEEALLRAAIESYAKGYRRNPGHYYSGINALTLMHLYHDLMGDPRYDREQDMMAGSVRYAAECETDPQAVFWAKATVGDLEVLIGTPQTVGTAYREAVARNRRDWFALDSCRAQLLLLQDLGFRPENVSAGIAAFDRALERLDRPEDKWQPRTVLLFSGHVVDPPGRNPPRLPADKEAGATARIAAALDELGAGPEDLALCQAASGGDLLFLEECQRRKVPCQVMLPFSEPDFITRSILPSENGPKWSERFYEMKLQLTRPVRILPDELGPAPHGVDPFERCNLWLLFTALAHGVDKVRFVCLWNGERGEGPGGTAHMHDEVQRRTGRVTLIDTRTL